MSTRRLDLDALTPVKFEEFCFRLLEDMGFRDLDWRRGTGMPASPADRGRDIVAKLYREDIDGTRVPETWFIECKHHIRGVPPTALQSTLSWALADRPHAVLFIASNHLSNGAKDHLAAYERNNRPPFRIRVWERPDLERLDGARSRKAKSAQSATSLKAIHVELSLDTLETIQARYFRQIIELNMRLDVRGFQGAVRPLVLPLDEVYVPEAAYRITGQQDTSIDPSPLRSESSDATQADPELPGSSSTEISVVLGTSSRIVLLGDPGSGKTTLLRMLALKNARACAGVLSQGREGILAMRSALQLPCHVHLAAYAVARKVRPTLSLRSFLAEAASEVGDPARLERWFSEELDRGTALVLLDGLDEITEPHSRVDVVREIERLAAAVHRDTRLIITSRAAGYELAPLGAPFYHYRITPLSSDKIVAFLGRWCTAVEDYLAPDRSERDRRDRSEREVRGILDALESSTGMPRLATNPLLLTLLAIIHRTGARLPRKRADLYEAGVRTLTDTWLQARGFQERQLFEDYEIPRYLGAVAFWLHENRPGGGASEAEIRDQLEEPILQLCGPFSYAVHQEHVRNFFNRAVQSSGLLVAKGTDEYGFLHLCFQEYLAALRLMEDLDEAPRLIYERKHDPKWLEPILLGIGLLSKRHPKNACDLVFAAILCEGPDAGPQEFVRSPYEDFLHRDLLLTARALGECSRVPSTAAEEVARRIWRLWLDVPESPSDFVLGSLATRVLGCIRRSKGSQFAAVLANHALDQFNSGDLRRRWSAARALGELGIVSDQVIQALLSRLRTDPETDVHNAAAQALAVLASESDLVVTELLRELRSHPEPRFCSYAGAIIPPGHAQVGALSEVLLTALGDTRLDVRSNAAAALGRLGLASPEVIDGLLAALRDPDEHARVHREAIQSLGKLGARSDAVLDEIVSAFRHDPDVMVRERAARALARSDLGSARIVSELITSLGADPDPEVRSAAALALQGASTSLAVVIGAVRACLSDDSSPRVREAAAVALAMLAPGSPDAGASLMRAMGKDRDAQVRSAAAMALARWRSAPDSVVAEEVVPALLHAAFDRVANVRKAAVTTLGQLGKSSPEVVGALVGLLRAKDEPVMVHQAVGDALGELGEASPDIMQALLATLTQDGNSYVRASAAAALGRPGMSSPEAVAALVRTLGGMTSERDAGVREAAAIGLGCIGRDDRAVTAALLISLRSDSSEGVRKSAVVSLMQRGASSDDVIASVINAVRTDTNPVVRYTAARYLLQWAGRREPSSPSRDDWVAREVSRLIDHSGQRGRHDSARLLSQRTVELLRDTLSVLSHTSWSH